VGTRTKELDDNLPGHRFATHFIPPLQLLVIATRNEPRGENLLAYAAAAVLLGSQLLFFGVAAKAFAITEGLLPEDESFDRWFKFVTRETGLIVGVLLVLVGLGVAASPLVSWEHYRVWAAAADGDDAA